MSDPRTQLYLVTPAVLDPAPFASLLGAVLDAVPVACVRLDLASEDATVWEAAARAVAETAHAREIAAIVRDHHRLVEPAGLDGVHLAARSTPVRAAREALGPDAIVGASAGTSRHDGLVLAEAGADYVSFGPVGGGLLGDEPVDPALFAWWAEMIEVPSVAEGGVGPSDARGLGGVVDFLIPDRRLWDDPETVIERLSAYVTALEPAP